MFFRFKALSMTLPNLILAIDSTISLISGLALFFAPSIVGNFLFQKQTDGVHWHLIRCVGGQILASSVFFWRFRQRERETQSASYVLRVLSSILAAFLFFHSRSVYPDLVQPIILKALIWFSLATLFTYFSLLMITGWPIGGTIYTGNKIGNMLYQLDSIASVVIGMAWIMEPHWLLKRQVRVSMDESHELCGRMMGVLFVSSQMMSSHALHWKNAADRALAAEARALCCLLILSAQIWSQIAYGADWSDNHWVGISLFSTWTIISILYRAYIWLFGAGSPVYATNGKMTNGHAASNGHQSNGKVTYQNGNGAAIKQKNN